MLLKSHLPVLIYLLNYLAIFLAVSMHWFVSAGITVIVTMRMKARKLVTHKRFVIFF